MILTLMKGDNIQECREKGDRVTKWHELKLIFISIWSSVRGKEPKTSNMRLKDSW